MEVKEPSAKYLTGAGFKQTEVGFIPSDWVLRNVAQFSSIKTGPFGTILKAAEYSDGNGVPLISVGEIRDGWLRISSETPRVPETVTRRLPQYLLRAGDIVFGRKGGVERSALIKPDQEGWFLGSDSISVRPQLGECPEYIAVQFRNARVRLWLIQHATGTTMASLNQQILGRVTVPFPPSRTEQQAIATALSDADALIESLEQLLAKKRQIKQGAMQELLTAQRRLPGFEGEWGEFRFGSWGKCFRGVSYNPERDLSSFDTEATVRLLRSNNVQHSQIVLSDVQLVNSGCVSDDQGLRKNDVLVCMANGSRELVGKAARFDVNDGFAYTFGAFMGAFRPDSCADPEFVFYCFQSESFRKHVALLLAGSSINNLNPGSVESCVIRAPLERTEQTAIAQVLSDMDADIAAVETRLTKARAIKLGMMQELLTGRIRLV